MLEKKPDLGPRRWFVLLANCDAKADLFHASEHTGSNIRAPRVVAEVLRELFFAAVRSREARANRHVRHGDPSRMPALCYG